MTLKRTDNVCNVYKREREREREKERSSEMATVKLKIHTTRKHEIVLPVLPDAALTSSRLADRFVEKTQMLAIADE